MGMTRLNIYVSATDNPCGIDEKTWYVTIYDCDGNVLKHAGKTYVVLKAPYGHLSVDVPPGIYYIKAVWSFSLIGGIFYVNHFTDAAIVHACCGEHQCVRLFNPSIHRCGTIVLRAVQDLVLQKAIKPAVAKQHEAALKEVLQDVPQPKKLFELGHLDEIEKLVRAQESKKR